ncbi:putative ER lumen protein-retaining receptor C28H8.4 isoform X2 [Fagus crenata]
MKGGPKRPIHAVATWVRRQPPKIKAFLAVVSGIAALLFLRMVVHDHDNLFVSAEAVHALGISVLIFKLTKEKTCAGAGMGKTEDNGEELAGGIVVVGLGKTEDDGEELAV